MFLFLLKKLARKVLKLALGWSVRTGDCFKKIVWENELAFGWLTKFRNLAHQKVGEIVSHKNVSSPWGLTFES